MAKTKTVYFCKECGAEFPKWFGKCTECNAWGTAAEEKITTGKGTASGGTLLSVSKAKPIKLKEIKNDSNSRSATCFDEVNRVLGGGIVDGSLILLGGEPGIGKSTLLLQMVLKTPNIKCLYVSGEESPQQIRLRADRIGIENENCVIYPETSVDNVISELNNNTYNLVIIDSIQTIYSQGLDAVTGGVSQIRESTIALLKYAKESYTPIFLIGHITKDGAIAGPKILEHIVDVVLQFEGDQNSAYRILRAAKNRFGATSEIGVFEMCSEGLREIKNPSEILLNHYEDALVGIAVGATIDGIRPYLLEVQALVSPVAFGMPQRTTTGFDSRRLNMLLAVVEKRLGYKMSAKDTFINIAGGFKVKDTGLDLAVIAAILSSLLDIAIPKDMCFCGEVGLSGEVRPAPRTEYRVSEAARLGFKTVVVSKYVNSETISAIKGIKVISISKVEQLVKNIMDNQ